MTKEMNKLRELSNDQLLKKRKELVLLQMSGSNKKALRPLVPIDKVGQIRKSIARIDTLMGERNQRGFNKPKRIGG